MTTENTGRTHGTRARKKYQADAAAGRGTAAFPAGPTRSRLRRRPEPLPGITAATDSGAEPRRQKQYFLTDASELV